MMQALYNYLFGLALITEKRIKYIYLNLVNFQMELLILDHSACIQSDQSIV